MTDELAQTRTSATVNSRRALHMYLQADLAAHKVDRWRAGFRLTKRILHYQRLLRRAEYYEACRDDLVGRTILVTLKLRLIRLGDNLGFEIPRGVFGPGLRIAHLGSIAVNEDARVGARCILHPCTTLGDVRGANPVIGDDVYIGPGVRILGGVRVGSAVAIAANSVVLTDVPDGVTVAGAPARIVSARGSAAVHGKALPSRAERPL